VATSKQRAKMNAADRTGSRQAVGRGFRLNGNRVAHLRRGKALSQSGLVTLSNLMASETTSLRVKGISKSTVQNAEYSNPIDWKYCLALARILEVDVSDILMEHEKRRAADLGYLLIKDDGSTSPPVQIVTTRADITPPVFVRREHIAVFICNTHESDEEVDCYYTSLKAAGFDVWKFSQNLDRGRATGTQIKREIEKCDFFLLVVSANHPNRPHAPMDLGFARKTRNAYNDFRPLILPLYSKTIDGDSIRRPSEYPVRDFETSAPETSFRLDMEGFSMHEGVVEQTKKLIEYMKPQLLISRIDFVDPDVFEKTEVFSLYNRLFPPEERDDEEDIKDWVLRTDVGKTRYVAVPGRGEGFEYALDSRYCILSLGGRAIGLSFLTYDYRYRMMYGNYIAVEESWRSHNLAWTFANAIKERLILEREKDKSLFPDIQGIVFEVEIFDIDEIDKIISRLEQTDKGLRNFENQKDRDQIRRMLRVYIYETGLKCNLFLDSQTNKPLAVTSPCLDLELPLTDWKLKEEKYWLMWQSGPEKQGEDIKKTWEEAVRCVYIEILGKSVVDYYRAKHPRKAAEYWRYAREITEATIDKYREVDIYFGKFEKEDIKSLVRRWFALDIPIPI
jgi:hypothetical protein